MSTPTPRTKPIDLSKCKVGQRVKLRNGEVATVQLLDRKDRDAPLKAGGYWYAPNGGCVPNITHRDIVALLPLTKKSAPKWVAKEVQGIKKALGPTGKKAKEPAKKPTTLDRFASAFAKITFKGDNDLIRKAADQLEGLLKP